MGGGGKWDQCPQADRPPGLLGPWCPNTGTFRAKPGNPQPTRVVGPPGQCPPPLGGLNPRMRLSRPEGVGPRQPPPCHLCFRSPRELLPAPLAAGGLPLLPQPLRQLAGHPPAGHLPAGHQCTAHEPADRHVQVARAPPAPSTCGAPGTPVPSPPGLGLQGPLHPRRGWGLDRGPKEGGASTRRCGQ